jgi:hypothetical protein
MSSDRRLQRVCRLVVIEGKRVQARGLGREIAIEGGAAPEKLATV